MTPAQQIKQSCRQSAELAARLGNWIGRQNGLLANTDRGTAEEISHLIEQIGLIAHAADVAPMVGIVGQSVELRLEVAETISSKGQRGSWLVEGEEMALRSGLQTLLPGSGKHQTSAVIRFSKSAPAKSQSGLLFSATLLDRLDVIKILTRTYLYTEQAKLDDDPTLLQEFLAEAEDHLSSRPLNVFSEREARDIAEHMRSFAPMVHRFRMLEAQGFCKALIEVGPHMPDHLCRRLISFLWRSDPEISALFDRLDDTLRQLGNSRDIMMAREALVSLDGQTGWLVSHPHSVIDTATLGKLNDEGGDETVAVASNRTARTNISRACLTVLLSVVTLPISSANSASSADAEILLFPSTDRLNEVYPGAACKTLADRLPTLLASVKATYLAERSFERFEVTSLVVCVDAAIQGDDTLAREISRWVELTHGMTPEDRESVQDSLFVVVAPSGLVATGSFDGPDLLEALRDEIALDQSWLDEWTPAQPFRNIFIFDGALSTRMAAKNAATASTSLVTPKDRQTVVQTAERQATALERLTGRWLATERKFDCLSATLGEPDSFAIKIGHLETNLVNVQRRIRSKVNRHLGTSDVQATDLRRQQSNVARNKLIRCAEQGRLGLLLRAFEMTEAETALVLRRHGSRSEAFDALALPRTSMGHKGEASDVERIARTVTNYWIGNLERIARSNRFSLAVQLPQSLLLHVVDELARGAERVALTSCMTERLMHLGRHHATTFVDASAAALLARLICVFVETLKSPCEAVRKNQFTMVDISTTAGHFEPMRTLDSSIEPFGQQWPNAYRQLVERNITDSAAFERPPEQSRELVDLLAALSTQSYEAAQ